MSRPRKPFGANHPGRLPATMMKVLAAEISDPSRLRRGKQYAKDGSVLDIVIDPGAVTGEIQGSRSTPYIAVVEVRPGDGMPLRRDVTFTCTCPDNDNWDNHACKHVVATMFALSDEFLLEPALLDVWRAPVGDWRERADYVPRPGNNDTGHDDFNDDDDDDDMYIGTYDDDGLHDSSFAERSNGGSPSHNARSGSAARRHLRLVRSGEDEFAAPEPSRPIADPLADLLRFPDGAELVEVGDIDPLDPQPPKSRELAAVLRDALASLRIDWN